MNFKDCAADVKEDRATIFIVDDDCGVRESIKALLEPCGFECLAFESGEAFLDGLRQQVSPHGCAILDLRLKGMSGLAVLRELRHSHPCVVTVLVTAFADIKLVFDAMESGATSVVAKPYRDQELWEAVSSCLAIAEERVASRRL